jgi:flagellar hook-basal body complex protein FliE
METEKKTSIQAFASGEEQNVHELMITLQKAGLAMSMTSAVRNKVMEAYKEVMHLQF